MPTRIIHRSRPISVPEVGIQWKILVFVYLFILIAPVIRTRLVLDSRFGWGMFSDQLSYRIEYTLLYQDGRTEPYFPGDELRGRARRFLGNRPTQVRYGIGALRYWLRNYTRYLMENHAPDEVYAVEGILTYSRNLSDEKQVEVIRYSSREDQ